MACRGIEPDLVGVLAETMAVADEHEVVDESGMSVVDRFLAVGMSRASFDAYLAAGQIAVAGQRITDAATPAPAPTAVAIMLPPG